MQTASTITAESSRDVVPVAVTLLRLRLVSRRFKRQ